MRTRIARAGPAFPWQSLAEDMDMDRRRPPAAAAAGGAARGRDVRVATRRRARAQPHRHDYHELMWTRRGRRARTRSTASASPVRPGTVTLIGRGQVHVFERARGLSGAVVRFGAGDAARGRAGAGWSAGAARCTVDGPAVGGADASRRRSRRWRPSRAPARRARARPPAPPALGAAAVGGALVRRTRTERRDPTTPTSSSTAASTQVLERDFARHHDAAHYADALAVPAAALSRALAQVTGRTTKQLITDRVMLEAARLLRFTDLTVGEIAFRAGFEDQLYFSRAFKRHYGGADDVPCQRAEPASRRRTSARLGRSSSSPSSTRRSSRRRRSRANGSSSACATVGAARLTLVACPAGFGKSTLLAAWRETELRTRPVAWVTLDEGDNDAVVALDARDRGAVPRLSDLAARGARRERAAARGGAAAAGQRARRAGRGRRSCSTTSTASRAPRRARASRGSSTTCPRTSSWCSRPAPTRTLPLGTLRARGQLLELRVDELRFTVARGRRVPQRAPRPGARRPATSSCSSPAPRAGPPASTSRRSRSRARGPARARSRRSTARARTSSTSSSSEVLAAHAPELQALHAADLGARAPVRAAVRRGDRSARLGRRAGRRSRGRTSSCSPLDDRRQWFRFHHLFAQILRRGARAARAGARAHAAPARVRVAPRVRDDRRGDPPRRRRQRVRRGRRR